MIVCLWAWRLNTHSIYFGDRIRYIHSLQVTANSSCIVSSQDTRWPHWLNTCVRDSMFAVSCRKLGYGNPRQRRSFIVGAWVFIDHPELPTTLGDIHLSGNIVSVSIMLYLLVTFEVDFNLQSVLMGLHVRRVEVDIPHGFAWKCERISAHRFWIDIVRVGQPVQDTDWCKIHV
jgi:hypothetical protein